uniref:5-hydroxytryptamine (serotonin) receptor 2C, G protein-coupled-like 1 n=1 Tax=Erpetoichthys calabaricus TaxID=27687 RepID=A0A8C4SDH9_ERPCA
MMSSPTGILVSLTTVSLDVGGPHGGLMAWHVNNTLTLNQSLPTAEALNVSDLEVISRITVKEKNWPALLFVIIIILTIGGNILVIMAVTFEKKLQNATNFFLMSLAVADMLVGILVMPVSLINILYNYAWPLPNALCPIWIYWMCFSQPNTYPIEHSRFNSRTKAMMKIAAVWTISIGISMPIPVIGLQDESKVFVNGSCVLNEENFVLIGSFVAFFIPLIIMVFTYCLTVQVLQRQATVFLHDSIPKPQRRGSLNCLKKDSSQTPSDNISMIQSSEGASQLNSPINRDTGQGRKGMMQAIKNERRASKVLGVVFFLFLLMWCPFFVVNIMSVLCKGACNEGLLGELLNVFVWVGYISSGINPLVYTLFNKTYRRAFSNYVNCQYKNNKKPSQNLYQPYIVTPTMYGKDINLNSYRNGNEPNSMDMDDNDEALEMQIGTSEVSINSSNVIGDKVSCV